MANFQRLIFCALVALASWLPASSYAAFPATQTNTGACTVAPCYTYSAASFHNWPASGGGFTSASAACQRSIANYNAAPPAPWSGRYNGMLSDLVCSVSLLQSGAVYADESMAVGKTSANPVAPAYSCPSGSTLSGSSCSCDAPKEQSGTGESATCVDSARCSSWAGQVMVGSGEVLIPRGQTGICMYGCDFPLRPDSGEAEESMRSSASAPWFDVRGIMSFAGSGKACPPELTDSVGSPVGDIPTEINLPPLPCPKGQLPGTVNGVAVCAKAGEIVEKIAKETTKSPPGGPPDPPEQEVVEKKCVGEKCTTTTTKNPGKDNESSETVVESIGAFCANPLNKGHAACKGGGGGGGDEGDGCEEFPGRVGCVELGTPEDGELPTDTVDVGVPGVDVLVGFGIGRSCPSPLTFEVQSHSYSLSFAGACDAAPLVKPLVILAAAFGAMLIVYAAIAGKV